MSTVDDLLVRNNAEQRKFNEIIGPLAAPDAIARLRTHARDTLRTDLSEDYATVSS